MDVVTRREWGARKPSCITSLESVQGVAVHYSASDADEQANHENCAGRVRGIQRYHMDTNGWCDIAYNHLICVHGYVFAGRGFGVRSAANGTNDGNSGYFAACFLGNDDPGQDFTDQAREALVNLRREYLKRYQGRETVGHRDLTSTRCPGDEIYHFIRSQSFQRAVNTETLPGPSPKPRWFWAAADAWLAGQRTGLPGPSPKPQWFWEAVEAWVEQHA